MKVLSWTTTSGWHKRARLGIPCRRRGIVVCSAPGSRANSAPAELAWALILGLMKRIPMEHQSVLEGRWQTGMTELVAGKCLGVVGLGTLGSQDWAPRLPAS